VSWDETAHSHPKLGFSTLDYGSLDDTIVATDELRMLVSTVQAPLVTVAPPDLGTSTTRIHRLLALVISNQLIRPPH